MSEFGAEIKRLRTEKGWSQAQLAVYSETSQPTVNQIETGKRNPSTETLVKLARTLGVEVVDLFPKAGHRSSPEPKLFDGIESERHAQHLGSWKTYLARRVEWGERVLQKSPEDEFNNPFLSLDTAIQWGDLSSESRKPNSMMLFKLSFGHTPTPIQRSLISYVHCSTGSAPLTTKRM